MRTGQIRRAAAILAAIGTLVLGGAASAEAAPSAAATNLRITLTMTVTMSVRGSCCFSLNWFEGTGTFPRIGPAAFSGSSIVGCFITCVRQLGIDVVGANGRRLAIFGDQGWQSGEPAPPQTWTAAGSRFTGSGVYETTPDLNQTLDVGTTVAIELTGTLLPE